MDEGWQRQGGSNVEGGWEIGLELGYLEVWSPPMLQKQKHRWEGQIEEWDLSTLAILLRGMRFGVVEVL